MYSSTVPSQHGFHVKSAIPTIQEASQAEESGDSGSATPAAWDYHWRIASGTSGAAAAAAAVSAPPQQGRVAGVKGLLDLCAHSAMPPVSAQWVPLPSQVEVVGTAHSSTGVRRLVKAVLRGLRACQVPAPFNEVSLHHPCASKAM